MDDGRRPLTWTLTLAALLTAVAGFVDAHVYVNVTHVFVANQSGNVILFGIALGEGEWPTVAGHALSMGMFAVGVGAGVIVNQRRTDAGKPARPDLALLVEAALLAALIVVRLLTRDADGGGVDGLDYPVIMVGALAMGIQTIVIRRVGGVAVATTYESGAVARVGEETALAAERPHDVDQRERHLGVAWVLGAMVVSYTLGAALASFAGRPTGWLLVPLVVVLGCAPAARHLAAEGDTPPAPG